MHAADFKPRISEEAFQILLGVVEAHLASLYLSQTTSAKNEREKNCAKLTMPRPILLEQQFPSWCRNDFVRRYRCEAVIDKNLKQGQISISEIIAVGNWEYDTIRKIILPFSRTLKNAICYDQRNDQDEEIMDDSCELMEIEDISSSEPRQNRTMSDGESTVDDLELNDRMSLRHTPKSYRAKQIIREPKLVLGRDKTSKAGKDAREVKIKTEKEEYVKRPEYLETKQKLRSLAVTKPNDTEEKKSTVVFFWQVLFFILFTIAVVIVSISIARNNAPVDSCTRAFNFSNGMKIVRNHVFGQPRALEELSRHLATNSSEFRVLAFVGGTGVGKSWVAHIIIENFLPRKNAFQFVQPFDARYVPLSFCGCNLIVLENLNTKDIPDAVEFSKELQERAKDYCVLILSVINVQETYDNSRPANDLSRSKTEVETQFRNNEIPVDVATFYPLDSNTVRRCVVVAAEERNVQLSLDEIDYVVKSLMLADSGCKGAYAKVQLFEKNIAQ